MASTLPIQRHNVAAYHAGEFIGYVQRIVPMGASVICYISSKKAGFNKRRAEGIERSANAANICDVNNGQTKLYNQRDDIKFKMIREVKG